MSPKNSEFGSALPRLAEFQPPADLETEPTELSQVLRPRERTAAEKAQQMWDAYQDIKNAWVEFARERATERRSAAKASDSVNTAANAKDHQRFKLLDPNNPLAREFHATPQFQKQHRRLCELWQDESVRVVWREQMKGSADQWADVNGSWENYLSVENEIIVIETEYKKLLKEKFDERGQPIKSRRRTLKDDLVDAEMALADARERAGAVARQSPEIAAKILASELKKRQAEWQKDGFMWTASRRQLLEKIEKIVSDSDTLRLIVLEGEAGTGKTTFADALARLFTGADAWRATVKKRTKAGRELLADQVLEANGSPTVYQFLLNALTGKERPTDSAPRHDGRVAFIDEFNRLENDEAGEVATNLDGMRAGGKIRYSGLGSNPDDIVQPRALILAAQNPAGARFKDRTAFTPEVQRKLTVEPLEYPPQTANNPELYEAFLVVLKDADGRVIANPAELSPGWTEPVKLPDKSKQKQLKTGLKDGGALWRLSQMLHQSYENLASRPQEEKPRKNVLTDENPDALLSGRVLPPGDVFKWLTQYQTEVKKKISLEHFLSQKLFDWLNSQFNSAADAGDRQLYLNLAEKFGLLVKNAANVHEPLPSAPITPAALDERRVAELSPRVPRPIIKPKPEAAEPPAAPEFEKVVFDIVSHPDRQKYKKLEARLDRAIDTARYTPKGKDEPVYIVEGVIKECAKHPELVGRIILAEAAKPDKKLAVVDLAGFEKKETPTEFLVQSATNPYREALLKSGIQNIDQHPLAAEKRDETIDLKQTRDSDADSYRAAGLTEWADNLKQADFTKLTPDKRKIIEQEVKDGAIPIWMPDKKTQLNTTVEQYTKSFSPLWIKGSQPQTIAATGWWEYFQNLIQTQAQKLVEGVPDRPYLSLQKPTQTPDARTCSNTVAQQLQEFQTIQTERTTARLAPVNLTNPAEYGALQKIFTERARGRCPANPTVLNPIDTSTFIRFINLPLSSGGHVPSGDFNPDHSRLNWGGHGVGNPNSNSGFRLSVRVEF